MNLADACRSADAAEAAAFGDMYAAAPAAFAAASGLRTDRMQDALLMTAPGIPSPLFNRVIGLGTFEAATERTVDEIREHYRRAGVAQFWISVSAAAQPARLTQWLEARGFVHPPRRSWVQMQWGTDTPPAAQTSLDIREVRPEQAPALGAAIAAAFEMPPPMAPWLAGLAGRPGWHGFAALAGDQVVGGSFVFVAGRLAWLGMGSVLRDFRGRGGQVALMSARIRRALDLGCRSIHTETGEPVAGEPNPSLDNMVRCGFQRVGSRLNYALTL